MAKKCLKCGYVRGPTDLAPNYECPQCGAIYAKVEAAIRRESGDSENSSEDAEQPQAIKKNTAIERQRLVARSEKEQASERKKESSTHRFTKVNQFIAVAGALVLLIGVFCPIIQVPLAGSINFYNQGKGDGVVVLAIAALSILFAFTKRFRFHFYSGVIVIADLGYVLYDFTTKMNALKDRMNNDLEGNPFRGLADAAVSAFQLQWGWAVLLVGASLLIASALYRDKTD